MFMNFLHCTWVMRALYHILKQTDNKKWYSKFKMLAMKGVCPYGDHYPHEGNNQNGSNSKANTFYVLRKFF